MVVNNKTLRQRALFVEFLREESGADHLSSKDRLVAVLYVLGMTHEKIAQLTGLRVLQVKRRIVRIKVIIYRAQRQASRMHIERPAEHQQQIQ